MSIELVMSSNHLILCRPFSFCPQSSFLVSQLLASGSQSTGASASASVLPMNIKDWFPVGLTGLISLRSKGLSRIFSNTIVQKHQFFGASAFFMVQLSHLYMTTGKTIALTRWIFVGKVMSLLFNMLSSFVMLLFFQGIFIFNAVAAATVCSYFGAQENKICHYFHFFLIYLPWSYLISFCGF